LTSTVATFITRFYCYYTTSPLFAHTTRLCIYTPKQREGENRVPGVLWIHGGGYVMGSATMTIPYAEKLIEAEECVVVAPDYTLSIDKPFPASLLDNYTALLWLNLHADELGIRNDQIFVGGDSAGGGLAVALALYARDKDEVKIAFQMPLYPMLDDRMTSASMKDNDAPMWNEHANRIGWRLYLGELFGSEQVPAYAAPARETNYSGLPPAFTFVGTLDPFRDETVGYIENLQAAGVDAELHEYEGCYHAFDQANPKTDKSWDAMNRLLLAFQNAVAHCYAKQYSAPL